MSFHKTVPAKITTGAITVSSTPPTEEAQAVDSGELVTGTKVIAAGAKWIEIENVGYVNDGDNSGDVTVNGATWSVGRQDRFEEKSDAQNNRVKTLPEITIISTGSRVRWSFGR